MNSGELYPPHQTLKWAEALGQALHYASEMKRSAKIVLFCEEDLNLCLNTQA